MKKKEFIEILIEDVDRIYQYSMENGKFSVALKCKELLLRLHAQEKQVSSGSIKSLDQWSEEELNELLKIFRSNNSK